MYCLKRCWVHDLLRLVEFLCICPHYLLPQPLSQICLPLIGPAQTVSTTASFDKLVQVQLSLASNGRQKWWV